MNTKTFKANLKLAENKPDGSVEAMFSIFNKRDEGDDVVLPTFFTDGQEVAMSSWGHDWGSLPPGKGVIRIVPEGAAFDGAFFMDTEPGIQHYRTVKNLSGLQQWSFGFNVTESKVGTFDDGVDRPVRFLMRGETYEVSPVLIGMNRDTYTLGIKSGQSYADEAEQVLTACKGFIERSGSLADLRRKEGRVLSDANRKRLSGLLEALTAVQADIQDLLAATEPPKQADVGRLYAEYLRTISQINAMGA